MNILILILVVYVVWRLRRNSKEKKPRGCGYYSHERTHTDTLINMCKREVMGLRKELKDAGVIP